MKCKQRVKTGTALAAAITILIFAGCDLANDPIFVEPNRPETELDEASTPVEEDDAARNIMSRATGDRIFALEDGLDNGLRITGFKSAPGLMDYLDRGGQKPGAAKAVIVEGRYTFTIPVIGGKTVTSIGERAFSPAKAGNDDISKIVHSVYFPETIVEMGANLFADTGSEMNIVIPEVVFQHIKEREGEDKSEEDIGKNIGGDKTTIQTRPSTPGSSPTVVVEGPPSLSGSPVVQYHQTTAQVSAAFSFVNPVTAADVPNGWNITGNGTNTITASYVGTIYGVERDIKFTAVSAKDAAKKTPVGPVTVLPVRPFPTAADNNTEYIITKYDPTHKVAALVSADGATPNGFLVPDAGWQKLFNAIYTPNAPDSPQDSIESGKTAVAYNGTISSSVLNLFKVKVGGAAKDAKVQIKGTDLPAAASANATVTNPIVIDIGLPGNTDNSGLNFYIPQDNAASGLGAQNGDYNHIRFRVNKGASLVILADNTGYAAANGGGAGSSCPTGYFNRGCVEVMAGGKLRDGAFEGFPLGSDAVILNRYNSYLAVGPEDQFSGNNANKYYLGWLIGPQGTGNDAPRIEWAANGKADDYLEVRPGRLAINTDVTVKKVLGLIYNVWLVGGITVTIDAKADNVTPSVSFTVSNQNNNYKGLFANFKTINPSGTAYKIYGTAEAKIVIKPGSAIHKGFLTDKSDDYSDYGSPVSVSDNGAVKTITNGGAGAPKYYVDNSGISGVLDWKL
jgi:hypothetical protein